MALLLAAGVLPVAATPASAVQPGVQSVVVSDNPVRWTPHVLDGYVAGFAQVGNLTIAVGNFTSVRTAASTTAIPRTNIFAFTDTGEITSFNPAVNGEVTDVRAVGDGKSIWISGSFSTVNGVTARSLTKINVLTGQRDTSFAPPAFDGRVNQMFLRGNRLYLVGRFMTAGSAARSLFAAVDPATGALDPAAKLDISVPRKGSLQIERADITPDGSRLVAIGNFTVVEGQPRKQILMADLTTSPTSLANWSTEGFAPDCKLSAFDSYMRDVDISPDGKYFVVVTTGAYYANTLCDAASRWDFSSSGNDVKPTWVDSTGGDTLTRVAVTATAIYLGGHMRRLNNPFVGDAIGPGAVEREGLAAVDPRTGLPLAWNPGRTRGYGVYSFVATDTGLWIGSDTDRISNYQYHGRLAFMPVKGGTSLPADFAGSLPGNVYLAGATADDGGTALPTTSLLRRGFNGNAVTSSTAITTDQPFGSTRGLFMIDGNLYSGRTDGTFMVQKFDGTTFGPPTVVDQRGLTDFPVDLPRMTGLFYDPVSSRIYYTLANDGRLFYRYFGTQINVIGARRFVSTGNIDGLDWRSTRSLLLDGGRLYVGDSGGNLTRWTWDSVTGVPIPASGLRVSGPDVDGISWRATGSFVYAATKPAPVPASSPTAAFSSTLAARTLKVDAGASSTASGSITAYSWDFGDSLSATGATATHSYAALGTYSVKLTVRNSDNQSATSSRLVNVTGSAPTPETQPPADVYGAEIYRAQPDLYWRLNDNAGVAADSSASGNPGSYSGTVTHGQPGALTGVANTATRFNGASFVASGSTFEDPGPFSTEVWFNTTSSTGGNLISFGNAKTGNSSVHDRKVFMQNDGTLVFGVYPGRQVRVTSPLPYNDGRWHSVLATQSSAGMLLYVDGIQVGQSAESGAQSYTGYWRVGGDSAWSGESSGYFKGVLDEAAVYSYALSAATAARHYQLGSGAAAPNKPPVAAFTPAVTGLALSVDGAGSTDSDGTVAAYAWDFGDGAKATSVTAKHTYATAGKYTVTLTVTDDKSATGLVSRDVTAVAPANQPPVAAFSSSVTGLAAQLDASASTDPDGSLASYAWAFGDGTTGTERTLTHTYNAAGNYTVTLTVTDNGSATNAVSQPVTIPPPAGQAVAFSAGSQSNTNSTAPRLNVPAETKPGDGILLFATVNNTSTVVSTPTGVTGWQLIGSTSAGSVQTLLWAKRAEVGDAGKDVTVPLSALSKTVLQLGVYTGVSGPNWIGAHASVIDLVLATTHVTPVVQAPAAGGTLVSYWAEKVSVTDAWSADPAVRVRSTSVGTGSGTITSLWGDSAPVTAGANGNITAVAGTASAKVAMWSIILLPGA
ncbi:PKD domain-containing protein [Paenarthrobacter sp. Z7-10]|uniref:PKD domain-containing protein n=1 Tax=Paenarthrobacter sp. Z7-10 TaxID=2787635 RepID=UPI0022A98419|nr:PKD domain-containing protein [Paenarthrobacter sp. Z7-10]MCZ2402942.1 PKD domain-containing protein [Paenarthrobacter sp. Z7-10]